MAKIIQFKLGPRANNQEARNQILKAEAEALVRRAAELLSELDTGAQRIGWLLEDCLNLLQDEQNEEQILPQRI